MPGGGGGIWVNGASNLLRNCLIVGNGSGAGDRGGGVGGQGAGASIENCTIVSNFASGIGAVTANSNNYQVVNTISYFNVGAAMYPGSNGVLNVSNSCVTSTNYVTSGAGNITNNPLFMNVAGGNYRLIKTSPCVNAGVNQAWMMGALDLDGALRISPKVGGTVDIGAYEFYFSASGTLLSVQ